MMVYLFVMLSVSVLLHELGHVFAAKLFKIDTRKVVLYPFGGIAFLKKDPSEGSGELLIAVAGPAVNMVLSVIGYAIFKVFGDPTFLIINLAMAIFNLIPAYPMDGGRVLRSILSSFIDKRIATRICMGISIIFSIIFLILGVSIKSVTLPLVSFVLFWMIYKENKKLMAES
jgi:Zn-dependent protease